MSEAAKDVATTVTDELTKVAGSRRRRLHTFITDELTALSKVFRENEQHDLEEKYKAWATQMRGHGCSPGQAAQLIYDGYKTHCHLHGKSTDNTDRATTFGLFCHKLNQLADTSVETVVSSAAAIIFGRHLCDDITFAAKFDKLTMDGPPAGTVDYFAALDAQDESASELPDRDDTST